MMQWLGSYCNQRGTRCCYPPTGKPKPDFTIYGLWPYYNDGSFPYNCGDDNYDVGRVNILIMTFFFSFDTQEFYFRITPVYNIMSPTVNP